MLELEVGTLIAPEYERRGLAASSGCIQGIGGDLQFAGRGRCLECPEIREAGISGIIQLNSRHIEVGGELQ